MPDHNKLTEAELATEDKSSMSDKVFLRKNRREQKRAPQAHKERGRLYYCQNSLLAHPTSVAKPNESISDVSFRL